MMFRLDQYCDSCLFFFCHCRIILNTPDRELAVSPVWTLAVSGSLRNSAYCMVAGIKFTCERDGLLLFRLTGDPGTGLT